jgi:hypothetical protein
MSAQKILSFNIAALARKHPYSAATHVRRSKKRMGSTRVTLTRVTLIHVLAVGGKARGYYALMSKVSVVAPLAIALVLLAFAMTVLVMILYAWGDGGTDRTFLFLFGVCVGFVLGYNVRAMISVRRTARVAQDAARERLMRVRDSGNQIDFISSAETAPLIPD